MNHPRDVVVTGLGVVCPLGVGVDAFWAALQADASGIDWLPELRGQDLPVRYAARIRNFDPKLYVQPRKTIKVMCQEIQAAYAAAGMALDHAQLAKGQLDPDRFGVVLGSEMLYGELDELSDVYRHCAPDGKFHFERWADFAFKDLFPLWMLKYLPNMAACHISIAHDARGPNNSIVEGGVSSLLAISEAAAVIRRGHADAMLTGGSGSLASFSCLPFRGWNQFTRWQGEPAAASRPFDAARSGTVPGEGAGALLLEARDHAERRGAKILARVAASASRYEPPATPPHQRTGRAIVQSIQSVLDQANLSPADIGHVNAHGNSSIDQDRQEAQAIHQTLGPVPVTALKSYFGDLAAGSGAVELIASVLALRAGQVPPTRNLEVRDENCPIDVISGAWRAVEKPTALALNQSSTGQAAALIISRE